jgi:uncharacterized membrane protein YcaP (DUF421 family)
MEFILRCIAIYLGLLLIFRIAGKRALAQITTFDIVLLLIIAETTQQALVADDSSLTNAFILIATFLALEIGFSRLTLRWPALDKWMNSRPIVLVREGRVLQERMDAERVNTDEVLTAARETHGLGKLEQIEHAVLETDGAISVIPRRGDHSGA